MNATQKIKYLILIVHARINGLAEPVFLKADEIEKCYKDLVDSGLHWDAEEAVRCCGAETGIPCEESEHYGSKSIATIMPDGSWVGWTYWHNKGVCKNKYGEPHLLGWINSAYDVIHSEVEKTITVQKFSRGVV